MRQRLRAPDEHDRGPAETNEGFHRRNVRRGRRFHLSRVGLWQLLLARRMVVSLLYLASVFVSILMYQ